MTTLRALRHIFLGHLWRFSLCSLYYIWWGIVVTRGEMAYFWVHYETPMCSHSFSDSRGSIVNAFSFNPLNPSFRKALLNTINSIQCADNIILVYKTTGNTCCCAPEVVEAYQGDCAHECCASMLSLSVQDYIQFHHGLHSISLYMWNDIMDSILFHKHKCVIWPHRHTLL